MALSKVFIPLIIAEKIKYLKIGILNVDVILINNKTYES